jgi:hypothetical protein
VREACWHQCPWCKADWVHSVDSANPPDDYFLPCGPCVLRHGFDAVKHAMKRDKSARKAATDECEDFRLCLLTVREEEA